MSMQVGFLAIACLVQYWLWRATDRTRRWRRRARWIQIDSESVSWLRFGHGWRGITQEVERIPLGNVRGLVLEQTLNIGYSDFAARELEWRECLTTVDGTDRSLEGIVACVDWQSFADALKRAVPTAEIRCVPTKG